MSACNGCGERHQRRYVQDERHHISSRAMAKGTATHKAAEEYVRSLMTGATALTKSQAIEIATTSLDSIQNIHDADADPQLAETKQEVITLAEGWMDHVAPTVNEPVAAEEHWEATIRFNGPHGEERHPIQGYVDAVDVDPESGQFRIRDWKTGKTYKESTYTNSIQMAMYTALSSQNGYATDLVRIDHLRVLKSGPKHQALTMTRGEKHHLQLARMVSAVARMESSGVFLANPWGWSCNEGCEFWHDCDFRRPDDEE